jgi:hypothetical protein
MCNFVFKQFGAIYWTDDQVDLIKKEGLIVSLLTQLVNLFRQLVEKKVAPIITPIDITPPPAVKPADIKTSMLDSWCLAIRKQEGYFPGSKSWVNHNIGNLKFTPLTQSFGAVGKDESNFAVFPDYDTGYHALKQFLTLACNDQLKDYHDARTLLLFTRKYALPPNDNYAKSVAEYLGVKVDCDIKTLL